MLLFAAPRVVASARRLRARRGVGSSGMDDDPGFALFKRLGKKERAKQRARAEADGEDLDPESEVDWEENWENLSIKKQHEWRERAKQKTASSGPKGSGADGEVKRETEKHVEGGAKATWKGKKAAAVGGHGSTAVEGRDDSIVTKTGHKRDGKERERTGRDEDDGGF
eukprot:879208-Pleurochrysis_carterae.AAC.1